MENTSFGILILGLVVCSKKINYQRAVQRLAV